MTEQHIHIVCFDIPFPATYGGVIDVYYKIKAFAEAGVVIDLHCFYKGELHRYQELERLCRNVYYYPRNMSFRRMLHRLPFAVCSRQSSELLTDLLKDDAPILFEGLVSCALLAHPALRKRAKFFRESNIEHDYYYALFRAARTMRNKLYYLADAIRLRPFESCVRYATAIFAVAHQDEAHFRTCYPEVPTYYIPSFHPDSEVSIPDGTGDYILYHGNLDVSENYNAARIIMCEIAPQLPDVQFVLAGRYNNHLLDDLLSNATNVRMVANPDEETMNSLIHDAQIHLLITEQATGLKLKLLNVLYKGRHIVVNDKMVAGTDVSPLCHIASTCDELVSMCQEFLTTPVSTEEKHKRTQILSTHYNNNSLRQLMINAIFK